MRRVVIYGDALLRSKDEALLPRAVKGDEIFCRALGEFQMKLKLITSIAFFTAHFATGQAVADVFSGPYDGTVLRVVDGDTFEAQVEVWPNISAVVSVRVRGVDAPETRRVGCVEERTAGLFATEIMNAELFENNPEGRIRLENVEADVWSGRVVADVFRPNTSRQTPLAGQLLAHENILEWTPDQADIPWCVYLGADTE